MTRTTSWCLLVSALLAGQAAHGAALQIDLLPGEVANIVDLQGDTPVTVAVLGSAELDVRSVEVGSLRLSGATLAKDAEGRTHVLKDVDADGYLDLVVQFAARQMRLGMHDTAALLEGKALDGRALLGSGKVQVLEAVLAAAMPSSSAEEKETPLHVQLASDPSGGLVVLGSPDLDPRAIALGSIRVNDAGIGKGPAGDVVAYADVNGDGREDAVLWPRAVLHGPARFEAATRSGRMLVAGPAPAPAAEDAAASADKSLYPFQITIHDAAPATSYPAVINVSGATGVVSRVRVVINGIIHPCFNDLDIMLVAPSGQSVVLMSDVGGCSGAPNATFLTFDDKATQFLSPGATPATPSTYRVTNNGAGDPFPAPAPAPSGAASLAAFHGTDPNGAWKLYIVDDTAGGSGAVQRGWSLDLVTMTEVCDPTPLVIPDSGPASLYPSWVLPLGLPPQIGKVTVTLKGLTHGRPNDLDVMLVGALDTQVMLMSDAGGISPAGDLELTFDDDVWGFIPDEGVLSSFASQPADYEGTGDPFPAPAPVNLSTTDLKRYRGENPNVAWRLFIVDDTPGFGGVVSGGWCLRVTSIVPTEACLPASITIPASGTSGPASIYPSNLVVTGASGLLRNIEVRLLGLSHTYPDDLDIVLRAPSGHSFSVLSDAGGSTDVNSLDVTLSDSAATFAPDSTPLGPGPYRRTDYEGEDALPGGPSPPYGFPVYDEWVNGNWSLYINDDATADIGALAGGFCLYLTTAEPTEMYCSDAFGPQPLTIPNGAPGITSGPATPYPWQVYVPLQGTIIRKVRVRLENLSHSFPDDLDVMLEGPQGQKTILMSDAGGSTDAGNQTITFDYHADPPIPDSTPFVNGGVYRQQNYEAGDVWPAPAPSGTFSPDLFAYTGTDPFGHWNLWVVDDAGQDVGSIGRWCLEVLPLYPPGEATRLRWFFDKTQLQWDAAPNATNYFVLRGTQAELPNLLTADTEGCIPDDVGTGGLQMAFGLASEPPPGTFYWYLVMAESGVNEYGPAGDARLAGVDSARVVAPTNLCAAP